MSYLLTLAQICNVMAGITHCWQTWMICHNLAVLTESLNSNPHSLSGFFCFTFPVLTSELSHVVIFKKISLTEIWKWFLLFLPMILLSLLKCFITEIWKLCLIFSRSFVSSAQIFLRLVPRTGTFYFLPVEILPINPSYFCFFGVHHPQKGKGTSSTATVHQYSFWPPLRFRPTPASNP